MLCFNTISNRQINTKIYSLSGLSSGVEFNASLHAAIPSLWEMHVYKDLTSIVTKRVLGSIGISLSLLISCNMSLS